MTLDSNVTCLIRSTRDKLLPDSMTGHKSYIDLVIWIKFEIYKSLELIYLDLYIFKSYGSRIIPLEEEFKLFI